MTGIPEYNGTLESVLGFLGSLESASIHYQLASVRPEALMVSIAVPGERWEVEFLVSGTVEVEVFTSDGAMHGEERLAELVERFSG
jgi:hypothetical protein